jgi:alkylated DNA repair dioxygenase AlkB
MATQAKFSDDFESRMPAMPGGFHYQENILSEEEEASLVASLDTLQLKPFAFHGHLGNRRVTSFGLGYGHLGNRRVTSFGLGYDYARRMVEPADALPLFLTELRKKAAAFAGRSIEEFQQAGVNQYPPGAGIGWHKDKPQFGVIVGISLLAPATLRLRRASGKSWIRRSHELKPRSIYLLDGEARKEWEHSVPPVSCLRYALMFRTVAASH